MPIEKGIRDKVTEFISHNFAIEKREIKTDESLLDQGLVDSFGFVECLSFIEKEFSIAVTEDLMTKDNFGTVDKMVSFIANHVVLK